MQAQIISIGTELLLGHITNTNASYLSQKLAQLGIDVYYHQSVGDNPLRLKNTIKNALKISDIIITTGGLGPTIDDVTLGAIVAVVKKGFVLNKTVLKDIENHFKVRNLNMPYNNVRQAYIPKGAIILKNEVGTAPGLIIKYHKKLLIALPGPPNELIPMTEKCLIPFLKAKYSDGWIIKSKLIKITGLPESAVNEKVSDILKSPPPLTVGIYAHPAQVDLKIMAKAKDEKDADKMIKPLEDKIRKRIGNYIFGVDNQTLEEIVGQLLTKYHKTLSIAESCTGGFISNLITNISGSSNYFKLGIIVYNNQSKISQLKISPKIIKKYGAVSPEVAQGLASVIRKLGKTDFGLGITGIAGPGGATKTKPIGLVYIALASPKEIIVYKFTFIGNRTIIKLKAASVALDILRKYLIK